MKTIQYCMLSTLMIISMHCVINASDVDMAPMIATAEKENPAQEIQQESPMYMPEEESTYMTQDSFTINSPEDATVFVPDEEYSDYSIQEQPFEEFFELPQEQE